MPPKRDDALPGDRLLILYQRLTLKEGRHFLADLARDLGRSPQAVTRMVGVIEAHLGKDAYIERGLEGRRRYFRLRSNSEAKALGFSFEELRFLANCRDLAAPYLPKGVAERIDRTLGALVLHLGERAPGSMQTPAVSFRSKGYIDYSPYLGTISALRDAIASRRVCDVLYRAGGRDEAALYRYAPGGITAMAGTLYVQGYRLAEGSLLKERATTFSLHRISRVTPTGERFGFDAAPGEAHCFGLDWHEPRRVSIRIDAKAADYVRDRIWSDDQTIENLDDGSLVLTVTTTGEKELQAWVWSFGGLARFVEAPPEGGAATSKFRD